MRFRSGLIRAWPIAAILVATGCGGEPTSVPPSTPTTSAPVPSTSSTPSTPTTAYVTTTTTTASTTTTVEAQPDALPLDSVVGGEVRGTGWLVEPGRYRTTLAGRVITFATDEPIVYFPSDIVLRLGPNTNSETMDRFFLTEFVGVMPPDRVGQHAPHDPKVPSYTVSVPSDLGTWLNSVSQVSVADQYALDTATLEGNAWDVDVDGSNGGAFSCPFGTCIGSLVQEEEGVWVLFENARFRLIQFRDAGDGLFGFLQSRPESFEGMAELVDMVLEDMAIEESS